MTSDSEQTDAREFSRVRAKRTAIVSRVGEADGPRGRVVDVSLGGAFIEGDFSLMDGAEVLVSILLNDQEKGAAINAAGTVVRSDSKGVAIEFRELRDLESYGHLRNLVLYNARTTASVEEEFKQHKGIARGTLN